MKLRLLALVIAAALIVSISAWSDAKAEKAANKSANQWLALVDAGDYAASWDNAAQYFKNSVSKAQWAKMLGASRGPLGKVESRKLKSATYATSLPGAPDGEYVVIQYDSSFEHKKSAIETVTPMLDKDGQWRVSGYFIK
ncbi:MAG: DUF4019 domain-containing protein [Terriglobales bacterium]